MTEAELKKIKWDSAARVMPCYVDGCTYATAGYIRSVESDNQPDDEKEKLWLCQDHFSMALKPLCAPVPPTAKTVTKLVGRIKWVPFIPGLNLSATSLEAEETHEGWWLVSRGVGGQFTARTMKEFPTVAGAVPVRKDGDWYWQTTGIE